MDKWLKVFLWSCLCLPQVEAQNKVLRLTCNDHAFTDSLICNVAISDRLQRNDEFYYPVVYNPGKIICCVSLPDSIYRQYTSISFRKQSETGLKTNLMFRVVHEKDTTVFMNGVLFWEETDTLTLYLKHERRSEYKDFFNHFILENYTILNPSREIYTGLKCMHDDRQAYRGEDEKHSFLRYKKMVAVYPTSKSLLQCSFQRFKNLKLEWQEELFSLFSRERQQSYIGCKWQERISVLKGKFKNMPLENCLTGQKENIVSDGTRYTFVIFSASWCASCHKLIPLLKELYLKKKDFIEFVYISMDEVERRKNWLDLLCKEQIPWRSLFADEDVNIWQTYQVGGIPCSYLIYPNGHFKRVDIRKDSDKEMMELLE